jgi:hypothetical protein
MRAPTRKHSLRFVGCLALLLAGLLPTPTSAQWVANGNPVCGATGDQSDVKITSDGLGGAAMVWADYRFGPVPSIYAQQIDRTGAALWTSDGVALCTSTALAGAASTCIAYDGASFFYYAWVDTRGGTGNSDIFAALTNGHGSVQTTPNGMPLCNAPGDQKGVKLVYYRPEDTAFATWSDARNGNDDIFMQGFVRDQMYGPANGAPVYTGAGIQAGPVVCSDGGKGAIVAWQDDRNGNNDIYVQRIERNGVLRWSASGVPVCTNSAAQFAPIIVSDGAGGAIVAWEDRRNTSAHTDLYAQHINHSGAILWAVDGVPIRVAADLLITPRMISDGQGGAILAWQDYRNFFASGPDIFAQRVNGSGNPLWLVNGVPVCTAAFAQASPDLATDGSGGAVIAWQDLRVLGGSSDLYAQHLDGSGGALWAANGVAISNESHNQFNPVLAADSEQGTIIAFQDQRNTGSSSIHDVFATRFANSGLLGHPEPVLLSVTDVPDDNGGAVHATFRQGDGGPFTGFQIERATAPPAFVPIASVGSGGGPIFNIDVATTADQVDNTFRVVATTPQLQQCVSNSITAQSVNNHVCPGSVLFDTANGANLASPGALYTAQTLPQNWGVMAAWSPALTSDWTLQASSTSFVPFPSCFSNVLASAPPASVTYLAADLRTSSGMAYGMSAQSAVPGATGVLRWITATDLSAVNGYGGNGFDWSGRLDTVTPIRVFRTYLYAGTREDVYYTSSAPQPSRLRIFRNAAPGNAWFSPGDAILDVLGTPASPVTPATFVVPATDWYLLVASMSANPVFPEDTIELRSCGWQVLPTQQSILKPPMSISGFPWTVEFQQPSARSGVLACRVEAPGLGPASVNASTPGPDCGLTAQASCYAEYGKVGVLTVNCTPGGLATGTYRAAVFHVYANPTPIRMEWDAGLGTIGVDGAPTTRSFTAFDLVDAWDVVLQSGTTYYFEFAATGTLNAKLCLNKGTGWDGRTSAPGDPHPEVETNGFPYASYVATRTGPHTLYVVNDNGGYGTYSFRVTTIPPGGAGADTPGDALAAILHGPPPPAASGERGAAKVATLAFVADSYAGVSVVDVSAPSTPTLVGALEGFQGNAVDIRMNGDWAVVAGNSRLSLVDLLGSFVYETFSIDGPFGTTGARSADIDAAGYVVAVTATSIALVDWRDPQSPSLIDQLSDVTDPRSVVFAAPDASRAYVADWLGGLLIFDTSRTGLGLSGTVPLPGNATDVEVANQYAYVACGDAGLAIVRLDPSPVLVGTVDTHGFATGVAVDGWKAYVTNGSDGIAMFDVSNPASPQAMSFLETPGSAHSAFVANGHVFVADGGAGLLVFNQPAVATGVPSPQPEPASTRPVAYALSAYPNPLAGRATLSLATPRATPVVLDVFDLAGRRVKRVFGGDVQPGVHAFTWDGSDGNGRRVAAGVYIVRAGGPQLELTRRVVVLR